MRGHGGATLLIEFPFGERRTFFEDGDVVILRGYCEKGGLRRLGFGICGTRSAIGAVSKKWQGASDGHEMSGEASRVGLRFAGWSATSDQPAN